MVNPVFATSVTEKPRRRLLRQYHRLGSYQLVAEARGVNVNHVYKFIVHNVIPVSKDIQRALGLRLHRPVTINQLMQLPIQDMPTEILAMALEQRKEMTS
jgi:hypothetical protein